MTAVPTVPVVPTGRKARIVRFIVRRLSEASTYRGGIMILTAAGVMIDPTAAEKIIALGMALAGVVGLLVGDTTDGAE